MKKGDTFTLRYRVVLHKGTLEGTSEGTLENIDLPKLFEEYSTVP